MVQKTRASWDEYFMAIAAEVATRSTCDRKHVGAVIVRDRMILATGYNVVDVAAARERRIPVTNVPTYGTASVAQHTFALLLELTQHAGHHHQTVLQGRWGASPDFCYWDHPLIELAGRTLGLVGLGRIGRAVARIAQAFDMAVLAASRSASADSVDGIRIVPLETLFRESDVVSLHCPLTPETRHLVNAERLSWMKPTAFLINTARGGLVDHAALAASLAQNALAGAALDVQEPEPPDLTQPPWNDPRVIVTPHAAFYSTESVDELRRRAARQVGTRLAGGRPENVVNPDVL